MEDMLLSDEVDHDYVKAHYPELAFNFQDIADFFAAHEIHSPRDLLLANNRVLFGELGSAFR